MTSMTFEEAVEVMEIVLRAWMRPGSTGADVLAAFGLRLPDTVNAIKEEKRTAADLAAVFDAVFPYVPQANDEHGKPYTAAGKVIKALAQLQAIVDALPKCWRLAEDGQLVRDVPIVEGFVGPQTVFMRRGNNPTPLEVSYGLIANKTVWDICCATREAAIALAKQKEQTDATH